jgi:hypothetical protein
MFKKTLLFIFILSATQQVVAQTPQSRELVYNYSVLINPIYNPGLQFGLEYGLFDKVNFINGVSRGKKSSYNLAVNQLIFGFNVGTIYRFAKSTDVFSSLTAEFRRTTPKRKQFQIGFGPGYMLRFSDDQKLDHPISPFLNSPVELERTIAPMAFIGIGKFRMGKHKFQFWHVRAVNYFRITGSTLSNYSMLELRLGFHKRPV